MASGIGVKFGPGAVVDWVAADGAPAADTASAPDSAKVCAPESFGAAEGADCTAADGAVPLRSSMKTGAAGEGAAA